MKTSIILVIVALLVPATLSMGAQNLLVNGGFESGNMNGWTTWNATWTSGKQAVVSTATKVEGNYAAALSCNSGSWGVYQQVTVTAGKRYKVDGSWAGYYSSGDNWFEVLLLDGAFDFNQVDNGAVCPNNYIAGYDPARFTSRTFGWEQLSSVYTTTPYIQNGTRIATGTVMTLVLKSGGFGSPVGYFDNMSLQVVPEPSGVLALGAGIMGLLGTIRRRS